jgi:hypothetical protein
MLKGYILIKLVPGFESTVLSSIRAIPGVLEVNPVFGHWDTVAIAEAKTLHELSAEAKTLHELSSLVISQIRGVQGVQDTETLVQGEV